MKKSIQILSALLTVFAISSARTEMPIRTSLIALLANPKSFDSKNIIVSGYVCSDGAKGFGLLLTRSDCDDFNYSNGVRLITDGVPKTIPNRVMLLTVEGQFKDWSQKVHTGEMFQWGAIEVRNLSGRSLR